MSIGTNFRNQAWSGADLWKNGYQHALDPDRLDVPAYHVYLCGLKADGYQVEKRRLLLK